LENFLKRPDNKPSFSLGLRNANILEIALPEGENDQTPPIKKYLLFALHRDPLSVRPYTYKNQKYKAKFSLKIRKKRIFSL